MFDDNKIFLFTIVIIAVWAIVIRPLNDKKREAKKSGGSGRSGKF